MSKKHFSNEINLSQNDCHQIANSLFTINNLTGLGIHVRLIAIPRKGKGLRHGTLHILSTRKCEHQQVQDKLLQLVHKSEDNPDFVSERQEHQAEADAGL